MKCTTQQFLTHSQNCATITTVHFVTCSLLEERNLISISSHYLFIPSPKHYITINLTSICIDSPILNISYKLNYRICSLYVWLLLNKFSRFIHVVAFIVYSFAFLMNNVPFMVIYFYLFLILLLEDFCFFLTFLAAMNNAAMSIYVQVFVWTNIFKSFEYLPRSGLTRSYCNFMFNILRNCKTVSQSECMILHSHHQYLMVSTSPYLLQCLLLSLFYY